MESHTKSTNPTNDTSSCVICFEHISLDQKAIIKNCAHAFCFVCIKSWMETTITCPLCKQTIDVLQHSFTSETTFEEETVEAKKEGGGDGGGGTMTDQDQLECLDHSFFITEVQKLLQDAERRHRQLWQEGQSHRGLSMWEKQQMEVVETVTSELRIHKRRLNALLRFDPHQTLQELYRLQDLLQTTWDRVPATSYNSSRSRSPVRYSADDADAAADDDDDEDFAEEMSYMKIGKGKGSGNGSGNGGGKKKGGAQRQSKSKYRTPADKIGEVRNRKGVAN